MKKLLSLFSALSIGICSGFSSFCIKNVEAVESKGNLVILGDSISSGYGLETDEYNYGQIIGEYLDYDVDNFAVAGLTTSGLIDKLNEQEVKNSVSGADIIIVSIGGNDFINSAREVFSSKFGEIGDLTDFNEIFNILSQDINTSLSVLGSLNVKEFRTTCNSAIENITNISNTISSLNPDATVVFQNIYDPFQITQEKYDSYIVNNSSNKLGFLGVKRAVYYNICTQNTYEKLPSSFNVRLKDAVGSAHVADICGAFTSDEIDESDLTLPYGNTSYFTDVFNREDRDFHPNQKGHLEIASAVLEELGINPNVNRKMRLVYNKLSDSEKTGYPEQRVSIMKNYADVASSIAKGDYTDDNIIDAGDASAVLALYAQNASSDKEVEIDKNLFVSIDVNGDDKIDASDASTILAYYAKQAANENPSWDELI